MNIPPPIKEELQLYPHIPDPKTKHDERYNPNTYISIQSLVNYDPEFEDSSNVFDSDWNILIEVYPDAENFRLNLCKISQKLGFLYQVLLLDKQLGAKAEEASVNVKKEFLERYFGKNVCVCRLLELKMEKGGLPNFKIGFKFVF